MKALDNDLCRIDIIERSVSFLEIKNKSVPTISKISQLEQKAQYTSYGTFRPEMVSLAVLRLPFPAIFLLEDKQGNYHALGEYANDLITSIVTYLDDCADDDRHISRRVEDTRINLNIIRCTNSLDQVNNLQNLLKTLNIFR